MTTVVRKTNANGAMLMLRSLMAMGHSVERIASALGEDPEVTERLIAGKAREVRIGRLSRVRGLFEAWWCYRPPEATTGQRTAAILAERRAQKNGWCCPAGLDEERLHESSYRPWEGWRPARGLGVADDNPLGLARRAA